MADEPELLGCPFCGEDHYHLEKDDHAFYAWLIHSVDGRKPCNFVLRFDTQEAALKTWNRRAPNATLDRLVEALRVAKESLERAGHQFEFYVEQHMAKSPPDAGKADTNREFVGVCADAWSEVSAALAEYDAMKAKGE
jgi:hypothetical protein